LRDQFFGKERNHPFGTSIHFGRNTFVQRGNLRYFQVGLDAGQSRPSALLV
jgi:hypothetical protein